MDPRDVAAEFVRQCEADHPDLERLVVALSTAVRAAEDGPAEDPGRVLDELAEEVGGQLARPQVEPGDAEALVHALFGVAGFRGDRASYGSPDNSRIDRVLRRRRGIPLSLSVVALLVGRRLGVDLDILGLPGHVVLRDPANGRCYDAFDGGRHLREDDLRELVSRLGYPLTDGSGSGDRLSRFEAMGTMAIVDRWSRNLRTALQRVGDEVGVDGVLALELLRRPPPPDAVILAVERATRRGAYDDAAALLDRHAPVGETGDAWRAQAIRLRARLN